MGAKHKKAEYSVPGMVTKKDTDDLFLAVFPKSMPSIGRHPHGLLWRPRRAGPCVIKMTPEKLTITRRKTYGKPKGKYSQYPVKTETTSYDLSDMGDFFVRPERYWLGQIYFYYGNQTVDLEIFLKDEGEYTLYKMLNERKDRFLQVEQDAISVSALTQRAEQRSASF